MKHALKRRKKKMKKQLDIKIQVDALAWTKFMTWVELAKGEVSAFGIVEQRLNTLIVMDFVLLDQVCNSTETDIDPKAIAQLMQEVDDPSTLRCWAHSHADMKVFWSGTDEDTIAGLSNDEWMLSLVVNKDHDAMMRLDVYYPAHVHVDNVVWELLYDVPVETKAEWKKQFKDMVTEAPDYLHVLQDIPNLEEDLDLWEDYHDFGQ
jgi:Ni,Fe-hydrogenase III component G